MSLDLDCEALHECADLLHAAAADRMEAAQAAGSHLHSYVPEMRQVVALEEVAAEVEAKIADNC